MAEENFNWLGEYLEIQKKKDIKNSSAFELLNKNNIDTNELTNHEKQSEAGVIDLEYKDEKVKEDESYNWTEGLIHFAKNIPESSFLALTNAAINGIDVGINLMPVLYKSLSHTNAPMMRAYEAGDKNGFNAALHNGVKDISDRIEKIRASNKEIAEDHPKVLKFISMVFQDAPYAAALQSSFKKMGFPNWVSVPLAFGVGAGFAYSEEEYPTMFLNSEQILELKKTIGVLEGSSDEVIWNAVGRITEGTAMTAIAGGMFKALKFARDNIPAYAKKKLIGDTVVGASGGTVLAKSIMDEAKSEESIKTIIQKMKEASDHPDEFPSTDSDFSALSELSSDPENFPSTDYDFEVILGQKDKEPTTDAEIDKAYGKGSVEKEFERLKNTEEKKIDDQSSNKTMMEEFYALDKTQLQKISEATGYPVDKLQSAGANKIFTDIAQDPKTWQKVKKIITGISRQKKTIPTTLEQQQLAIPFIKTFDDDVKVLTYKVDDSVGKFSDDLERNLDIEALVKNDFDKKKIINTAVQQAKKYDQDSVFVSEQVLGRTKGSNAAFSVRFSTSKKFGDVIDISKELEKITGLQGYTFKTKALNLDTLPIANPKFIPNKRLYHNAIKRNGTTSNFRVAAFIGPDGRMIDGGRGSQVARKVEHRDVVKLAYDSRKVTDFEYIHGADFSQMYRFMEETGSIRISANGPRVYVEIYQKPTLSQLKTLVKKYNDDESFLGITIEAVMPKGKSVKTFTRVEPEYMLELQDKINLSQLEKFLDFQAIRAKRFISIDSMNIPEYSNISNKAFIEKLVKIESNLSNTFGTKDISKPKLEYYINNVINKEDYAKYK